MGSFLGFPITQPFGQNGEQGVDIGTPYGTPLTSLVSGVVTGASYQPWGGEVDIATQDATGQTWIEKLLHLDSIAVQPGQSVQAGSTFVGLSGGQTSGGSHPVTNPRYSTGAHTEIDFQNSAGTYVDPLGIFGGGAQVIPVAGPYNPYNAPKGAIPYTTPPGFTIPNPLAPILGIPGAIAGIPGTIGHGLAGAASAAVADVGIFAKRQVVALAVAAVVLYILFVK